MTEALVALAVAAIIAAFFKGKSAGMKKAESKVQKGRDALQEAYDEIDRPAPDPDGAYKRLRRMSQDRR